MVLELESMERLVYCPPNCYQSESVYVHGGGTIEEFPDWLNFGGIDLIVVGSKSLDHGSGILSGKIVRLTDCNTLFITGLARGDIFKVMIPLDFRPIPKMPLNFYKGKADGIPPGSWLSPQRAT